MIKILLMANVHGENLHHPDTEAIKGRCIRTNLHHYILKCIKCSVDLATATDNTVEDERHLIFSCNYHTQEREALMSIINENCKTFSLLNIDAKPVWFLNNDNIDILCAICTFLKHI
jgi:hypothetical protein